MSFSFAPLLMQEATGLNIAQYYESFGEVPTILIGLTIMLFAGFLVTRLTKLLKLPNVTAYIIAGVLLGPWVLGAVSPDMTSHMSFVSDIALSFIAFGVGRYFKISTLKATGKKVFLITILESVLAGILVTVVIGPGIVITPLAEERLLGRHVFLG